MEPKKVVKEILSSSSPELSTPAKEDYQNLLIDVKLVCKINGVQFQEPLDAAEHSCKEIPEGLQGGLCNPPYNTLRTVESANSKYDRLNLEDMNFFVHVLSVFMYVGACGHIFCSFLQSKPGMTY